MITNTFQLQPRYGEVDQMGYVYHANYVIYCHQARNELLRKLGVDEIVLEDNHIILPVISFDIKYKKPAHFDERISIKTIIREMPNTRFNFEFEITNEQNTLLITAKSTVVFADKQSRLPKRIPEFIKNKLNSEFLS
ncbi:acyl-CoA thioesterase [Winogradskyella helgolandensis]|uniref:acyl-CoA thioesterase n=1 Tax=Winogradskyella helgolandensis TaxID=2697010 RepID=UPI0015BAED0C|nr:thioesterase family protein [Winogradskyella helgolandensis]